MDLVVTIRENFKPSEECATAVNKAGRELLGLISTISCRELKVFGPLYANV